MSAARKKTARSGSGEKGPRGSKNPEDRLFSGSKIARVLAKFNVDFRKFVSEYDQDNSRSPRLRPLDDKEKLAIERFIGQHRSINQLANDLSCSISSAQARVTRYVLEQAEHPVNV
jgi:hypothetical protein